MKKSLMMKILGVVAVVMMLSLVIATPASAKHNREVPIKGTVTGEWMTVPEPPPGPPDGEWVFSSEGTGQMSHLGKVYYDLTQNSEWEFVPEDEDFIASSKGSITFTAANGDTLVIKHEVESGFFGVYGVDFGFTLGGTWSVDEDAPGTGRFANAAGSGSIDGIGFINPKGPAVFDFEGWISYDASDRSTK